MQYQLVVNVEVDDTADKVHELMKFQSVTSNFWHSFFPPHHMEYFLGPLTETGVENWKKKFDATGCKYRATVSDFK